MLRGGARSSIFEKARNRLDVAGGESVDEYGAFIIDFDGTATRKTVVVIEQRQDDVRGTADPSPRQARAPELEVAVVGEGEVDGAPRSHGEGEQEDEHQSERPSPVHELQEHGSGDHREQAEEDEGTPVLLSHVRAPKTDGPRIGLLRDLDAGLSSPSRPSLGACSAARACSFLLGLGT